MGRLIPTREGLRRLARRIGWCEFVCGAVWFRVVTGVIKTLPWKPERGTES